MKSPFPGMDPYLERSWLDVHQSVCIYARDLLQAQVRPNLLVRSNNRLVVEAEAYDNRSIYPDVSVVEQRFDVSSSESESAVGVAEPLLITANNDPLHEGFVQIIDPSAGGKVVTVIKFLSISNKTSLAGTEQYLKKQDEVVNAGVSLVEIDLLRGGEWVVRVPEYMVPSQRRSPYRVCVKRGWRSLELEFYHLPIQQRLPKIRIPLREQDTDAVLDLQELIDRTYFNGGYDQIDYTVPPTPRFDVATAAWAQEMIANRNRQ